MAKSLRFIVAGIIFGIILSKSEALSWYRIQEMFRFRSFQMYGIIGTAVVVGAVIVFIIKRLKLKDVEGADIIIPDKEPGWKKYLIGGIIFGLGWALTGACPGPIFVLLGQGYGVMVVTILGALLGTYVYGIFSDKLPN